MAVGSKSRCLGSIYVHSAQCQLLMGQVVEIRLQSATAQFYHLVPHVLTKGAITSEAELQSKVQILRHLLLASS